MNYVSRIGHCPICISDDMSCIIFTCSHFICHDCITSFLKHHTKCPMCREEISYLKKPNVEHIYSYNPYKSYKDYNPYKTYKYDYKDQYSFIRKNRFRNSFYEYCQQFEDIRD